MVRVKEDPHASTIFSTNTADSKAIEEAEAKQAEAVEKIKAMNIYEKMMNITAEVGTVAKNLEVQVTSKSKYKAVSEADVIRALKPLLIKYRVYAWPVQVNITDEKVLTSTYTDRDGVANSRNSFFLRMEAIYRFINVDNPTEYVDVKGVGDGIDTGDKAPGKGSTYAGKYSLLKAFMVATGDDPDQEASQEYSTIKAEPITDEQVGQIIELLDPDEIVKLLNVKGMNSIRDMTQVQASATITWAKGRKK